jgi:hypothetical protein
MKRYLGISYVVIYKAEELNAMWDAKIIRLINHRKSLKVNSIKSPNSVLWEIREVNTSSWGNQDDFSRMGKI